MPAPHPRPPPPEDILESTSDGHLPVLPLYFPCSPEAIDAFDTEDD